MTNSIQKLNDKIDQWADYLTERLSEVKLYDVAEVKLILKTGFKQTILDCMLIRVTSTAKEYNELKEGIELLYGLERKETQQKLSIVKKKLKLENSVISKLDIDRQGKELVVWMREKHEDSLLEFYKSYAEKYPDVAEFKDSRKI